MKTAILLGDVNLDIILAGMEEFPSLGREIDASKAVMKAGGSATNVAVMLAAQQFPVRLYGRVGDDRAGRFVCEELEGMDVRAQGICFGVGERTGITVSLAYPGERMYVTFPGTLATTTLLQLKDGYIEKGAHLHLTSFFLQEALRPDVGPLLRRAKEEGMSCSLDPGGDPTGKWEVSDLWENLRFLDFFLPNGEEIVGMTGAGSIRDALGIIPREVTGVVVKSGSDGVYTRYLGKVEHRTALPVTVVDTTCAGDCFDAGFLAGILSGASFTEAVGLGLKYAARAVSCMGLPKEKIDELEGKR
jgi:sugar/nucleoside kinase (ribokinase family)